MTPEQRLAEIDQRVTRFLTLTPAQKLMARGEVYACLADQAFLLARLYEARRLLEQFDATDTAADAMPAMAEPSTVPRRVPTSDDTIACTPPTAVMALPPRPPTPVWPETFAQPDGEFIVGWNGALGAGEDRVATVISKAIRDGVPLIDLRTMALSALRSLRRSA